MLGWDCQVNLGTPTRSRSPLAKGLLEGWFNSRT
jgi:hypothetical protein